MRAPRGAPTARLACVRPAASVHPEPGSNSPLDMIYTLSFSSAPAAPGPPGPGPAGPSHRHAPTNAAPPGPPDRSPRTRPKANAKVARPRRTAKPRGGKFSPAKRKALGVSGKNFALGAKFFPNARGSGAFLGGLGGRWGQKAAR